MSEDIDYTQKTEKIVSGNVSVRKPGKVSSFVRGFINPDIDDLGTYIKKDLIKPYTMKLFRDILMDTVEIIFGSGKPSSSGGRTPASHVAYDRFATSPSRGTVQSQTPVMDYWSITFDTRFDAEEVLNYMKGFIKRYQKVPVARMYDAAGVAEYDWSANNYGWYDLTGADTIRTRDGQWTLKLPKPVPLN